MPKVIQSNSFSLKQAIGNGDKIIDFIFFSYLKDDILYALHHIYRSKSYHESGIKDYGDNSVKELLRDYFIEISS